MKPSKFLKSAYKFSSHPTFKSFVRVHIGHDNTLGRTADQWRKNKGYSEDWVNK